MNALVITLAGACLVVAATPGGSSSAATAKARTGTIVVQAPDGESVFPPGTIYLRDARAYDQRVRVGFNNNHRAVVVRTSRHVAERSKLCNHVEPTVVMCTARIRASHYGLRVETGSGDDHVLIGPGLLSDAEITPGAGDDFLETRSSALVTYAGVGADTILGGNLRDSIHGEEGADLIRSGPGEDSIDGDEGRNSLFAGPGDDYVTAINGVSDLISCGPGQNEEAFVDHRPLDRGIDGCERVHRHGG